MQNRGKRLTPKHEADPAQKPITGSISPEAKSGSTLPTLIPEEVLLSKEIDSLMPAQVIRAYGETLSELQGRYRKLRRIVLTGVYKKGTELMTNKEQYKEFLADPFWKNRKGERPKPDSQKEAVRWSVIRALNAKEEDQNKRATRDGNAFQQLANEGVQPDDLWKVFEKRGGRDVLSKEYVASKRPENSKSTHGVQKALTKAVTESVSEQVRDPRNFTWDMPNKRVEVISALVGARDGELVWLPIGCQVIDESLPDVAPDAVLFTDVRHIPDTKTKKLKK